MVLEPLFYVVALLSVFVHGMGKAGFGMGLPILAIPMMSLFISPIQALSILVIPLIFMDLITIHRFKGLWNKEILKFIGRKLPYFKGKDKLIRYFHSPDIHLDSGEEFIIDYFE